jgi:deoxyribodipyrimidine photo-lyase
VTSRSSAPPAAASSARIHRLNDIPVRPDGAHVLYWMVTTRRTRWSHALDRALEHARALGLPLVVLEALRADYPWASDRHHAFALAGMRDNARAFGEAGIAYHPYVEPEAGAGRGLLEALARQAAVVVTDLYPAFFIPRMQQAAATRLPVLLEAVDSNGLLPLAVTPKPFSAAVHFRRFLQKSLPPWLVELPAAAPLEEGALPRPGAVPDAILDRWPAASSRLLACDAEALSALPIDHGVGTSAIPGGPAAGAARLEAFLDEGLDRYGADHNDPDAEAASGLSPYLHWGHLSAQEVFHAVATRQGWSPARLGGRAVGKRHGWWGMSESAEAFLDELVTWRELGFTFCHHVSDYDRWETLPEWARATLEVHASDVRERVYSLEEFREARTHDELWNAAQRQLVAEGVIHNYLRMLWGKKILEWTARPREALDVMTELNNRYGLDGRDPNSYSGIFWVLGRFDRGWPERPIYGKVRSMSSDSTRRKVRVEEYLRRWGSSSEGSGADG